MKKLLLVLFVTGFLFSCVPTTPRYFSAVNYVDYDKYNKNYFMVTESNNLNFNYQTIKSFELFEVAGDIRNNSPVNEYDTLVYKMPDLQEAIDKLVAEGIKMKANGIMNLKIEWTNRYSVDKLIYPAKLYVTGVYFRRVM